MQTLALALGLAGPGMWLAAGAHTGWTRTSEPVKTLDEVTGLEGIEYRRRFVPGLDFLGAVLLGSSILAGASFLVRSSHENRSPI
jgi:hypothetical protein